MKFGVRPRLSRPGARACLAAAIALSVALVWASFAPMAGQLFAYGYRHWIAHFGAYAALAFLWRRGLPRAPALAVAAAAAAFGFAQEAIEVAGHAHGFELADALTDALGAVFGIVPVARSSKSTEENGVRPHDRL